MFCNVSYESTTSGLRPWIIRGYLVGVRTIATCGLFGEERVAITVGATSHF
jgi:hypothetical protein